MAMRIVAVSTIRKALAQRPDASAGLMHWRRITTAASWSTMTEIQAAFPKAKVLNAERARFDIAGGEFRLIVSFDLKRQIAFIKFFGTHAEYDKIDALTVSLY